MNVSAFFFWTACGFAAGTLSNTLFEWAFHRYVMHRNLRWFSYPFQKHARVHHVIFKADETYQLMREEDKKTVPMAWWNGPALILLVQVPMVPFSVWAGHYELLLGSTASTVLYYAAYEYLHWCMHVPKIRRVNRSGIFFRLNGHHLLHHRYMNKNFNVVFPLADLMFGTLCVRSPIRFGQARGPAVPDVQPSGRSGRRTLAGLAKRLVLRLVRG
ncbi:MAG TPA: sterol desaturase family protein [Candidatus Saccharimonadales bacterium]|nr:sterol desaturase family protein [Candidatus Saccharimonadales bacterium]